MSDDLAVKEEDKISIKDCGNVCRICLSFTDMLVPIFEGEGVEQNLEVKIQKYLPVNISVSDSLPQHLCFHCTDALVSWDSLISMCVESDKKLKSMFGVSSVNDDVKNEVDFESENGQIKKESGNEVTDGSVITSNPSSEDSGITSPKKKKHLPKKLKRKSGSDGNLPKSAVQDLCENVGDMSNVKTEALDSTEGETTQDFDEAGEDKDGLSNLPCEFCGKLYKGKRYLSRHIKIAHKDSVSVEAQKCNLCPNVYKTKANLEKHYRKEHVNNQVECPVCHASVHSKKLDGHLKAVHGVKTTGENEERFKCKFCEKWFRNKYIRNSHVKEIHLTEPMKCKLCDFRGARAVLRRHRTEVHAEKRFPCSLCHAAFKTLHTLKTHMTSHSDLRSFICDICGMRFKRLNNVRDHMKCHEQKSNQCQICGNFFARKRYLAIHEKTIHNFYADGVIPEEKGFECGICGSKLKWKKNLLAHMRIHTREKPYVCKICKKDFVCHGSLRTHMSKHGVCAIKDVNLLSTPVEEVQGTPNQNPSAIGFFGHFNI